MEEVKGLQELLMLAQAYYGLFVDKMEDNVGVLTIWVSVPAHSSKYDTEGEEMCGSNLAKRFKSTFQEFLHPYVVVLSKTREEIWTDEKASSALKAFMYFLYRCKGD